MRDLKGISKDPNYRVGYGRGYKKWLEEGIKKGSQYFKPVWLLNKIRFIFKMIRVILNNKSNWFVLRSQSC